MALRFHPKVGHVLMCDFGTGQPHQPPEMRKKRPVVVVSKELPGRPGLCSVIPLSTKAPVSIHAYHHQLEDASLPPPLRADANWAKCDMIATVSTARLDGVRGSKDAVTGRRMYFSNHKVSQKDMKAIRDGIVSAIHILSGGE